ncbi:hypothetical protein EJ02DRAFT_449481 [Clathrospora elynae]|uniref:Uncharacterized protein n=1 Tax=Clathrospora elynae TaxID=706981 RepID=A0A6A5T5W8_9PLEO|nr:hypothetical protein EJ02DRAFT_449481 [Clathrospora elynae]
MEHLAPATRLRPWTPPLGPGINTSPFPSGAESIYRLEQSVDQENGQCFSKANLLYLSKRVITSS